MDPHLLDLVQGALREGREGPHLLDLIAEKLDTKGITPARGEYVEETAANGELTASLGSFDPLVACRGEIACDLVQALQIAEAKAYRLGPSLGRWHPFAKSRRGHADETACLEHL
jgi:hypothetical protein